MILVILDFSPNTVSYLKARIAQLNESEKVVNQQVEYTRGNIIGDVDGVVSKGLLAIMVKS